jgi:prolyl oligopeptidase
VDPMHSRKFVAAMQNARSKGAVLLDIERNTAHNVVDDRAGFVQVKSDIYAFAFSSTLDSACAGTRPAR